MARTEGSRWRLTLLPSANRRIRSGFEACFHLATGIASPPALVSLCGKGATGIAFVPDRRDGQRVYRRRLDTRSVFSARSLGRDCDRARWGSDRARSRPHISRPAGEERDARRASKAGAATARSAPLTLCGGLSCSLCLDASSGVASALSRVGGVAYQTLHRCADAARSLEPDEVTGVGNDIEKCARG